MDLDHLVHVDARAARRATSTLMTSSSRGGEDRSGGVRSQSAELLLARPAVMRKPFCGPVLGRVVGLDQPVALEALQRRVHLADVERPHLAGAGLELLAQLQAVLRSLAQQGQQRVADAHRTFELSIILGM